MKSKPPGNIKAPAIVIDNSLEKYKNAPLFQDLFEKACEMIKKTGVEKIIKRYS